MKKIGIKDIIIRSCLAILIILMLTGIEKFIDNNVEIDIFGINNMVTDLLFNGSDIDKPTRDAEQKTEIDWATLYPFAANSVVSSSLPEQNQGFLFDKLFIDINILTKKVTSVVKKIEQKVERYYIDMLVGYQTIVNIKNYYQLYIGWDIAAATEYNAVVDMGDGYWTPYVQKNDVSANIEALKKFSILCAEQGIDLLYVQAPYKISQYEDNNVSGILDFSNQNADELLAGLSANKINYLDLRNNIVEEKLSHHDLFYNTDHHWKAETGLWAAKLIAQKLNKDYKFSVDTSLLNADQYHQEVYKDWFLGSAGNKVTLARAVPDDISLFYPDFTTDFNLQIPSMDLDVSGPFSILYDMSVFAEKELAYNAYCYADRPVIVVHNNLVDNTDSLLVIKDSFANCVVPFLATGIKDIYEIDIRPFSGSLQNYILKTQPDAVVVLYNPNSIKDIDYNSHDSTFDFR